MIYCHRYCYHSATNLLIIALMKQITFIYLFKKFKNLLNTKYYILFEYSYKCI